MSDPSCLRRSRPAVSLLSLALALVVLFAVVPPVSAATYLGDSGWFAQETPELDSDRFREVCFVDSLHGWVAGEAMIATTDGGVTWDYRSTGMAAEWGVSFVDTLHGWAVGGDLNPIIVTTSDGGITWTPQVSGVSYEPVVGLRDVEFVDRYKGWAVGTAHTILATRDGGLTWKAVASPTLNGQFHTVKFLNDSVGWIAGFENYGGGVLLGTTDGVKWTVRWEGAVDDYLNDVSFVDAARGWAAGTDYAAEPVVSWVRKTTDGGLTWTTQLELPGDTLNAVEFVDPQHGWTVGSGVILATYDGGDTWVEQVRDDGPSFFDLDFVGELTGWVVGLRGRCVATSTGGWTPGPSATLTAAKTIVPYKGTTTLTVHLSDLAGDPIAGELVDVQKSLDGVKWTTFATVESDGGTVTTPALTRAYKFRAWGKGEYAGAISPVVVVKPKVYLGAPVAPDSIKEDVGFLVYGTLKPRHSPGWNKAVKLYCWRKNLLTGVWVLKKTAWCKTVDYSTYSRYRRTIELPSTGTWKIRAYAPEDARHAATWSTAIYRRVR